MLSYKLGAAVLGIGVLWASKSVIRLLVQIIFPQALPGEENTALLATARSTSPDPATVKDLEDVAEYDYIIVGTGTAGCVLANRLSEDGSANVLAIEAGHSDTKQIFSRIPAGFSKLFRTPADWSFTTTPQPNCDDRKLDWSRGKMIGGCSSINAMMYTRGGPDDYDEWERLGIKGWSYKDIAKYFRKAEKFSQPNDARRLSPDNLAQHGQTGPWEVGYNYGIELTRVFPNACEEIGISKTEDINTDRGILGAAPVQTFIDRQGQRSSTAVAYLTADVVKRPNLKIASGQTVTKIIFDMSGSQPRAVGVEMAVSKSASVRYLAKAKKEVILCGGTIGTPQLLKLSGIGPADELNHHGIPLVKSVPGVGQNLMDHLAYLNLTFKTDKKESLHYLVDPIKSLPAMVEWFRHGTGPLTNQACDNFAFVRSADREDAPVTLADHTSGPNGSDLELITVSACILNHGRFIAPQTDGYLSFIVVGLRPESRGTVTLASSDPFDAPLIDPKALSAEYDVDILLYGIKLVLKVARSETYKKHFKGWYDSPHHPLDWDTATDEQIKAHIRKACETLYHPMGTAKMGNGADAVVDDTLKVHGVTGLRVVDASVFPTPLACHPCAPVVMVAEKAADLIKGQGV